MPKLNSNLHEDQHESGIPDSLQKRYLYKLLANGCALAIGIVAQMIIPRGLGPRAYGNFNFLGNFFTQVIGFLDMGTSFAFFTKISKRQNDSGLISFYASYVVVVFLAVSVFIIISHVTGISAKLWPNQLMLYVYLGATWAFLTWVVQILNNTTDAYGLTVAAEKARILQKLIGLAIISLLFYFNVLQLFQFFLYHYVIILFLCVAFLWVIAKEGPPLQHILRPLHRQDISSYGKEFYDYSQPLFIFSLAVLIEGIFDRWILQLYGGSIQQGFYSLSYQISAICILFTSAMSPLLIREFSISHGKGDLSEMARVFQRYIPLLFAIAAFFSCYITVQAEKVVYIMGGHLFEGACVATMIMAFYPIHQTYGQLTSSVFYATGQTGLYRNISVLFMAFGIPLSYFMIAPADKWGLNSGATGLAIKMVLVNILDVNVKLFFVARLLDLNFPKYVFHQVFCTGSLLVLALGTVFFMDNVWIVQSGVITRFVASGILYSLITAGLLYFVPSLFGLRQSDVKRAVQFCTAYLNR